MLVYQKVFIWVNYLLINQDSRARENSEVVTIWPDSCNMGKLLLILMMLSLLLLLVIIMNSYIVMCLFLKLRILLYIVNN